VHKVAGLINQISLKQYLVREMDQIHNFFVIFHSFDSSETAIASINVKNAEITYYICIEINYNY
jgi:hypothetical protein